MKIYLEQLLRQAWNSGMGSYHDTKTSKQLKIEEDDFIDGMGDELNLFFIHNVVGSKPTAFEKNNLPLEIRYAYNEAIDMYHNIIAYESGIIDKETFIKDTKLIKSKYK